MYGEKAMLGLDANSDNLLGWTVNSKLLFKTPISQVFCFV